MSASRQYSTFFADRYHFAIDVDHVQEVVPAMPVTPVPLTSPVVDGLVNLRGQIVTAIDLRSRLNLPRRGKEERSVNLIVRTSSGLVCLRADRLGDVFSMDALSVRSQPAHGQTGDLDDEGGKETESFVLEPLPDTVQDPMREIAVGIIQLDESLLLVLDPAQLLTVAVSLLRSENED